jgi:hypothetical protein
MPCATPAIFRIVRLFGSAFEGRASRNSGASPASPFCHQGVTVTALGSIGSNEAESSIHSATQGDSARPVSGGFGAGKRYAGTGGCFKANDAQWIRTLIGFVWLVQGYFGNRRNGQRIGATSKGCFAAKMPFHYVT